MNSFMKKLFISTVLFALVGTSRAQLTTLGSGSTAGTNDWVFALLNDPVADLLYVGGKFTTVGTVYSPFVASWNGSSWSSLGAGLNGPVRAFCKFQGSIYVAGEFTLAGSDTVNYVARWDGANWHKVGNGFNGHAITLCVFNNQLYAGGVFTQSGTDIVRRLARWNGSNWVEVGGGLDGPGSVYVTTVFTLAVFQNQLYVGGNFNTANNGAVTFDGNFARWNGFSWQDLPNYQSNPQDLVTCIVPHNNTVWVGGVEVPFIITFDGINWLFGNDSQLPSFTVNDDVYAVEFYDGKAFVGGMFTAAGASGGQGQYQNEFVQGIKDKNWLSLNGGVNNTVFCMEVYHDELYIGGAFTRLKTGSVQANYIARWKSPLEINITKNDVACYGDTDGFISLTPENGVPPYTYAWDNSGSASSRPNLTAGNIHTP
jgi:trimeric autotransporter adhesin